MVLVGGGAEEEREGHQRAPGFGSSFHHLHTSCSLPAVFNCVTEEEEEEEADRSAGAFLSPPVPQGATLRPDLSPLLLAAHFLFSSFFLENVPIFSPSSPVLNTPTGSQLARRRNFPRPDPLVGPAAGGLCSPSHN